MQHTRIYIDTPVGRVGIYEQAGSSGTTGAVTKSWTHKDPLDSIIAISDASGTLTFTSYDAWGCERDADDWTALADPIADNSDQATDRGFTGHEMLSHLDLIHMNGRIYDPVIARMISPDPNIQFPENLQSFNRYSYVMNRPLSLNDPSGFFVTGLMAGPMPLIASQMSSVINSESLSSQDEIGQGSEPKTAAPVEEYNRDIGNYSMMNNQSGATVDPAHARSDSISDESKVAGGLNDPTNPMYTSSDVDASGVNDNSVPASVQAEDPNYIASGRPQPQLRAPSPFSESSEEEQWKQDQPSDAECIMAMYSQVGATSPHPNNPAGKMNTMIYAGAVSYVVLAEAGIGVVVQQNMGKAIELGYGFIEGYTPSTVVMGSSTLEAAGIVAGWATFNEFIEK